MLESVRWGITRNQIVGNVSLSGELLPATKLLGMLESVRWVITRNQIVGNVSLSGEVLPATKLLGMLVCQVRYYPQPN